MINTYLSISKIIWAVFTLNIEEYADSETR